ncbi:hypothetical protein KSS87_018575 [Heliosperma pusillum]|nr:hypothetical protein KSS87_018575 [Heliosperma pusillum]
MVISVNKLDLNLLTKTNESMKPEHLLSKAPPLTLSASKQINKLSIFCEFSFSSLKFGRITIIHEPLPNRVLLPHLVSDGIDRDAFSFRQEEDDKQGHNKNPG